MIGNRIEVLGLTAETDGNATGLPGADVTTMPGYGVKEDE